MESFLSPSPFAWAPGIELRSPSLFSKPIYFYPVNHLKLQTLFEVLGITGLCCHAWKGAFVSKRMCFIIHEFTSIKENDEGWEQEEGQVWWGTPVTPA